jgi:signal peptidase II
MLNFFKTNKLFFYGISIAFIACFLDLFSKQAVFSFLENKVTADHIEIFNFFNLVHVWNRGVSFGMFSNLAYSQIIFSIIVFIILLVMISWLYCAQKLYMSWSLGLIIGGAMGNLYDRIKNGAVADFLDFHIGTYHWPAFNLADSFVFIGVVLLLVEDFYLQKK